MSRRDASRLAISAAIATGSLRAQATPPAVIGWLVTGSREASARGLSLFDGDPLATGLVKNLARPGGMITGLSNVSAEANLKLLELLVEAMPRLAKDKVQAMVLLSSAWFFTQAPKIIPLAQAQRWPVAGNLSAIPRLGGLLSFGLDSVTFVRRSAFCVDRILKGARPGDLPIEQPTAFQLIVNMKTARALGLTIPQAMAARATEVIE